MVNHETKEMLIGFVFPRLLCVDMQNVTEESYLVSVMFVWEKTG